MTTTATHLRTCALHWTDLHEAAGQPAQVGAFGLGLRGYLARLDDADLVDPRRWRYTGRRTAPYAALWLLARIERKPGPCRRLTADEEHRIGTVAAGAADRIERALDIAAQRRTLEQLHDCGGAIDVHGGEGRLPVAHCTGCGRIWAEGVTAA